MGWAVASVLLASGCRDDPAYEGAFDVPSGAAILDPTQGGPFEEPIGVVASRVGGAIRMMALKQGRYVMTSGTVSFGRGNPLPTGLDRQIESVATYAVGEGRVDVFAADAHFGQVLRIPWIVDVAEDGEPVEAVASVQTEPAFVDADGSGDSPSLTNLIVTSGYTTSENWSVEFDGERWWVVGSRSGTQAETAVANEPYVAERRALSFTITGSATAGDRFEFTTSNGIEEIEVPGAPMALAMAADQSTMAVILHLPARETNVVRWLDPATGALLDGEVVLSADSRPVRLDFDEQDNLLIADAGRAAVWEVAKGEVDAIEYVMPTPMADVTALGDGVYGMSVEGREIWLFDRASGQLVDLNPSAQGIQPRTFRSPVSGIDAMTTPFPFQERDDDDVRRFGRALGVTMYSGEVAFMEEGSGCLLTDEIGPRTSATSSGGSVVDYERINFSSVDLAAFLQINASNDGHVTVNTCGGIAQSEQWSLTYDRLVQAWRVKGSVSDEQERLAYEDERYVSDDGAVSFVIRAGGVPSEDGWIMRFSTLDGLLRANGDLNGDGSIDSQISLPADPVAFHYRVGGEEGGWQTVDDRPFVLVAAAGSDRAARVNPALGRVEVSWQ
jgi:hypothetical protein